MSIAAIKPRPPARGEVDGWNSVNRLGEEATILPGVSLNDGEADALFGAIGSIQRAKILYVELFEVDARNRLVVRTVDGAVGTIQSRINNLKIPGVTVVVKASSNLRSPK